MPEQNHTIADGDCITNVAYNYGFFWQTLWDHPANAELKRLRKDPNVLRAGDVLVIPERDPAPQSKSAGARHKFTLKGVPAKLRLRLVKNKDPEPKPAGGGGGGGGGGGLLGAVSNPLASGGGGGGNDGSTFKDEPPPEPTEVVPRANVAVTLEVDGTVIYEGSTDGDGHFEAPLPPNAREGRLIVGPGTPDESVMPLQLGTVDPIDTISGIRRRLSNLKFLCVPVGDQVDDDLRTALRDFQEKNKLSITGEPDAATKDKLKALHGC